MAVRFINDKWMTDIYIGKKRIREKYDSKLDARKREAELMSLKYSSKDETQILIEARGSSDKTLVECIRNYVNTSKKSERTKKNDKKYFEVLYDFLWNEGVEMIYQIKLIHLEKLQSELMSKDNPLTASTVNRYFHTYRNFFSKCVYWEVIAKSPCDFLKDIPEEKNEKRIISDIEIQLIVDNSPKWFSDLVFFMAITGLRNNELINLTFDDVDLNLMKLNARSKKGQGSEKIRTIPLHESLLSFFSSLKKGRLGYIGKFSNYVFLDETGKPISQRLFNRTWNRVVGKLGLDECSPYCLRHKYITELVTQKQSLEATRLLAGHSNLKTTQNYMHVAGTFVRETALDNFEKRNLKWRSLSN